MCFSTALCEISNFRANSFAEIKGFEPIINNIFSEPFSELFSELNPSIEAFFMSITKAPTLSLKTGSGLPLSLQG